MADSAPTREADVSDKHQRLLTLLREVSRDGLFLLDPANVSWFTGGAAVRGVLDPEDYPVGFVQNSYRWIVCANVDTQRLFDEELDGLGFQVKEWPWPAGRMPLLTELANGKRFACDEPLLDCLNVGESMRQMRRVLSPFEREQIRRAGRALAHAIEATCRTFQRGDSEQEIAGQLSHRLIHHGVDPISIQVSADGRRRTDRRPSPGSAKVSQTCVIQTTGRRFGLHVTAARAVSFGPPDEEFRRDLDSACRWSAVMLAACMPSVALGVVLERGAKYMEFAGYEHEWRQAALGWLTGHAAHELPLRPADASLELQPGSAVVWQANVGAASNADTVLLSDEGPQLITPVENWPAKRIRVGGLSIDRPDVLVRE